MTFRLQTIDAATLALTRETGRDPFGDPVERQTVANPHSTPCRATLEDALPGEEVLLFRYAPLDLPTPYRFTGPVFVRASAARDGVKRADGELPEAIARRLLSLRAFTSGGRIHRSEVSEGRDAGAVIAGLLAEDGVAAVHIHTARNGCWLATAVPA